MLIHTFITQVQNILYIYSFYYIHQQLGINLLAYTLKIQIKIKSGTQRLIDSVDWIKGLSWVTYIRNARENYQGKIFILLHIIFSKHVAFHFSSFWTRYFYDALLFFFIIFQFSHFHHLCLLFIKKSTSSIDKNRCISHLT